MLFSVDTSGSDGKNTDIMLNMIPSVLNEHGYYLLATSFLKNSHVATKVGLM